MTGTSHAIFRRNPLRAWACAFALGVVPLTSGAINKSGMSGFRYSVSESGKVASIRPNQAGSSGSLGSVGSIPSGHVGSQIGNTGWYVGASGSGNPSGGATMNMGHAGDVFFAGTKYPFQAGYQVPKSAVVDALGMLCKNPLICLGIAAASPAIKGWLGEGNVGINQNAADYPDKPFLLKKEGSCSADCREYLMPDGNTWVRSLSQACNAHLQASRDSGGAYYQNVSVISQTQCSYEYAFSPSPSSWTKAKFEPQNRKTTATWTDWMPASMDDIAPYMDTPEVPAQVVSDILDKGGDITLPSAPTVTGPSQVQGPKEETANADGSKTVKQTTNNYQTDGNRITNTSTTTVTQRCVGDGTCSPVTTTTTTNPDEKPDDKDDGDDCKKNPDSLACADLDTPSGEIPKATRNVSFNDENLFGGGACPADIYANVARQNMKIWDWQQSCGYITSYVRPVLLIICTYIAFMIVSGAARDGA